MVNIVALLRAHGGYPVEQVAGALQLSVKEIDDLSASRLPSYNITRARWSTETMAREVRRFFKREGRWPNSKDFRDGRMRGMGLPSWDLLREHMNGYHPRRDGWSWNARERALRDLRAQGLVKDGESLPENGWVTLQRWMVQNCNLTPAEIIALPNALIRREGMERYGFDRMIREGFGEHIRTDELGSLYRFPGERKGEPLVVLKVTNKTREPDGTFADYFLRVPPTMTIPKQAVAWSFNVTDGWEDFTMVVET
jgi:hypothetical protein